jgi:hypothetical protein
MDTATSTSPELLGEIVTWDIRGGEVDYAGMQDAMTKAGLNPDAAHELTTRSAFSRACKDLKKERAIDKLHIDKGGIAKFQFTTKKKADDGTIEYDFECLVELDCDTGAITCQNDELAKQAQELLAYAMQMRTAQDISRLVQALFEKNADLYPINPRKGVAYFVPEHHREFTARIDQFLQGVNGVLWRFPVPSGTAIGNASVRDAVESGLSVLLGELDEAVQSWDDTTRTSTMEKAAEKYQAIAFKIECHKELLNEKQEILMQRLEQAKADLRRKVGELKPEDEATPEAAAA